jgi:hypothetical protein
MNHEAHFRIRTVQNKYKKNYLANLLTSKKFRITISVVGIYSVVGSGIGWFLMSPNSDLASAEKLDGTDVSLKLSLENTNQNAEIVDIIADFYTSEDNIDWESMTMVVAGQSSNTDIVFDNQSFLNLNPITARDSIQYLVKGKVKNKNAKNITVMTHIKYTKNDSPFESPSNKVFFRFE